MSIELLPCRKGKGSDDSDEDELSYATLEDRPQGCNSIDIFSVPKSLHF